MADAEALISRRNIPNFGRPFMNNLASKLATGLLAIVLMGTSPGAQQTVSEPSSQGTFLLTIFLKHDQSKPLEQINAQLKEQGLYKSFPPTGIEIVSWYIMMGIGQVVTLRVPAERLREV